MLRGRGLKWLAWPRRAPFLRWGGSVRFRVAVMRQLLCISGSVASSSQRGRCVTLVAIRGACIVALARGVASVRGDVPFDFFDVDRSRATVDATYAFVRHARRTQSPRPADGYGGAMREPSSLRLWSPGPIPLASGCDPVYETIAIARRRHGGASPCYRPEVARAGRMRWLRRRARQTRERSVDRVDRVDRRSRRPTVPVPRRSPIGALRQSPCFAEVPTAYRREKQGANHDGGRTGR